MNQHHRPGLALRCAGLLIRVAVRKLPEGERADREMEWLGEAEAAACDPNVRFTALRPVSVLRFALSLTLHARAIRRAPVPTRQRTPSRRANPDVVAAFAIAFLGAVVAFVAAVATPDEAAVVAFVIAVVSPVAIAVIRKVGRRRQFSNKSGNE